jgi:metal-responsive CopG/Arc/MetJ family transcriptional regulator
MPTDLSDAIDAFSEDQPDKPARSETIRRIIRGWLVCHGYLKAQNEIRRH